MAGERDLTNSPEGARPFPTIEKLFSTSNQAQIIVLESAGGEYRNPRVRIDTLADKYSGIFGKKRLPRKRTADIWDFDAVEVEIKAERAEFAKPGDSFIMESIHRDEAKYMAKVLLSPAKDPDQIKQRQELVGKLAASDELDALIDLKDQTWQVFEGLWDFRVIHGNYRWEETSLIEHYYAGTEFIPILEDEYDPNSRALEKLDVMGLVGEAVDKINGGIGGFGRFGEALAAFEDPIVKQAFGGMPSDIARLQETMATLIPFDKKPVKDVTTEDGEYYYDLGEKREELDRLMKKVEPYFFNLSSVLEFAKKIRDEGWQAVTFDATKPFGYNGGWNLEEPKNRQTSNDSPTDAPITILSGANTSGKSFTMKSDFLIRIAAQSVGFAPVQSANLPAFDSFVFLDRATTDPENDLSAFMREIENWKLVLKDVGAKTRLYVDEGYSTTSPHDQSNLLLSTSEYVRARGGSVILATHNDLILDAAEQNPYMTVYNLHTEVGVNGDLIRHFKLQPGRSESLSLAVARARNFPHSALARAEEYLRTGSIEPTVVRKAEYPKVEGKTEQERDVEKQIAAALGELFPAEPTNPVFQLFSLDREMKPQGLLFNISGARERLRRQGALAEEEGGMYEPGELRALLGEMILWQPSQSPAEVLERQKLFEELLKDGLHTKLPSLLEQIGFLEENIGVVSRYVESGVNKGLNPFQVSDRELKGILERIDSYAPDTQQFSSLLRAADAYLSIQIKLCGDLPIITDLRSRLAVLREVNESVIERKPPYRDESLTTEEQQKALTVSDQVGTIKDLHKTAVEMLVSMKGVTDQLPAVGLKDIPLDEITEELSTLEDYNRGGEKRPERGRKRAGMMWQIGEMLDLISGGLPLALQRVPNMMESARLLAQTLKTADSVHLHQAANLIETQLAKHESLLDGQAEETVEQEIQGIMPKEEPSRFNHLDRRSGSLFFGRPEPQKTPYKDALKQVEALAMFAGIIEQQGFAKVVFNDTGEINFQNAFSVFKDRSDEVANNINFSPDSMRVQLLTGPNGSGKTFYEKGAIAGVLIALATGYAPAEQATMPVLDAVTYLDRVVEKQDRSYSAFSQEVEYWKELLALIPTKRAMLAAVDEAFSTTSPGYQAAFTSGVAGEFLESPHFLMLSTHNHDAVTSLTSDGIPLIEPHHLVFDVRDGTINYRYQLQPGHQTSHAIEVARTMGLPEEILRS